MNPHRLEGLSLGFSETEIEQNRTRAMAVALGNFKSGDFNGAFNEILRVERQFTSGFSEPDKAANLKFKEALGKRLLLGLLFMFLSKRLQKPEKKEQILLHCKIFVSKLSLSQIQEICNTVTDSKKLDRLLLDLGFSIPEFD